MPIFVNNLNFKIRLAKSARVLIAVGTTEDSRWFRFFAMVRGKCSELIIKSEKCDCAGIDCYNCVSRDPSILLVKSSTAWYVGDHQSPWWWPRFKIPKLYLLCLQSIDLGIIDTSRGIGTDTSLIGSVLPPGDWGSSLDALANRCVLWLYSMLINLVANFFRPKYLNALSWGNYWQSGTPSYVCSSSGNSRRW